VERCTVGDRQRDHRPVPVPVTEIPDPLIDCDFCSAPRGANDTGRVSGR
jgi:hypothetical protein